MNVAKILQIDNHLETESDQASLIDRICDRFNHLEAKKNGSIDTGMQRSGSLSGDRTGDGGKNSNESNRSSQRPEDNNTMSPLNNRFRKKQPKQSTHYNSLILLSLAKEGTQTVTGKYSPQVQGGTSSNIGLPMKLAEMRGENEVDSDLEERNGLTQDRLRLKKNISANGTYTLTKVAQSSGSKDAAQNGGNNNNGGQPEGKEEAKNRSNSLGKALIVDKMKKSNLTASNPIIGAPLANQIAKKTDKIMAPHV